MELFLYLFIILLFTIFVIIVIRIIFFIFCFAYGVYTIFRDIFKEVKTEGQLNRIRFDS